MPVSESEPGAESRFRGEGLRPGARIGPPWPGTVGEKSERTIRRVFSLSHARDLGALVIGTRTRAKRKRKRLTFSFSGERNLVLEACDPITLTPSNPAGESEGLTAPFSAPTFDFPEPVPVPQSPSLCRMPHTEQDTPC